jgi:hypothetical protein
MLPAPARQVSVQPPDAVAVNAQESDFPGARVVVETEQLAALGGPLVSPVAVGAAEAGADGEGRDGAAGGLAVVGEVGRGRDPGSGDTGGEKLPEGATLGTTGGELPGTRTWCWPSAPEPDRARGTATSSRATSTAA